MADAGLTRGGFYLHFRNKEELFAEALGERRMAAMVEQFVAANPQQDSYVAVQEILQGYLDPAHRDDRANGCPMASLGTDASRAGETVRDTFAATLEDWRDEITRHMPADAPERHATALSMIAECVGSLMLSRAVGEGPLSDDVLAAGRRAVARLAKSDED